MFTGGTGFLGRNAKPVLDRHYEVTTIGIMDADDLKCSLTSDVADIQRVIGCRGGYDIVLHAAGKAHIYPKTQEEIQSFYDINYQGTVNLCKALELTHLPKSFVFISTNAVYGIDCGNGQDETTPLNGTSPYAKSKIMAEEFLIDWAKKNNVILTIFRPCLLAGVGAPGNLGAMVRGIKTGAYLSIDHGKARKGMLMAEDIANLVILAEDKGGIYNICDDHDPSFGELEATIAKQLGKRPPVSIPYWLAKCAAWVGDIIGDKFPLNSARLEKIVTSDVWSNGKAKKELGWKPLDVITNYKI